VHDVVVKKFNFAVLSRDELLVWISHARQLLLTSFFIRFTPFSLNSRIAVRIIWQIVRSISHNPSSQ